MLLTETPIVGPNEVQLDMRYPAIMLLLLAPTLSAESFDLQYGRLATALAGLSTMDQKTVEDAISHIRKGDNNLALVRLYELNKENPKNSSLRILTAYALLRTGDLIGALHNAKQGEVATDGDAYKCWFLAKIAFVTGDKSTCKRELGHAKEPLKTDKELSSSIRAMEKGINKTDVRNGSNKNPRTRNSAAGSGARWCDYFAGHSARQPHSPWSIENAEVAHSGCFWSAVDG